MFTTLARHIVRRRLWILALVGLLTAFFASQIRNLQIVIDPAALLPQAHANVIGTNLAEKLFGSKYVVVVGVGAADGGSALRPEVLDAVARLTTALGNVPGVKRHTLMSATADKAKSITGAGDELRVEPLLSLPIRPDSGLELARNLAANPVYQNTLVSADGTLASISFSIQVTQHGFRDAMDRVQAVLAQHRTPQLRIVASGVPVFYAAVEHFAQRMGILFPVALLLIGLIHFEAFRTLQGLLLPLVTALVAVVWGLGFMGAAKVPMDAFNATTPILILAVAAGHAVQILKRYYEEFDRLGLTQSGLSPRECNDQAIIASLGKVAPVMIAAGSVAALGFFSLLGFELATIRTFGIFTGLGIVSALVIELSLIPALRSLLPPPARQVANVSQKPRLWDRIARHLSDLVLARRRAILAGFAALAALSLWGMTHIQQENSTKSYFGASLPVRQDDALLNARLAGTNTLYVVFQGAAGAAGTDRMKDPALLRVIEQAQRYIETLPDVGKTLSIVDYVRQMNRSMNGGQPAFDRVPATAQKVSQYLLLYSMSGQPTDFDSYIDYDYRNANLIVWMKNDSSHYAESVLAQIRAHLQPLLPPDVQIQIGGSVPQTSALTQTLVRGKALNIAQMIGVVFVAGMLAFRSVLAGLYLIAPLLVTVLVNFGVMGLTGIPLNTPNSVSSAMAIGIGADYAIYLLFRMREECERLGDFDQALRETMRTAGQAVVYVASAIAGGYSVLMLSFGFYVHIWFGILIVMSMLVSAATALVLVPTLLKTFPPAFIRRRLRAPAAPVVGVIAPQREPQAARAALGGTALALACALAGITLPTPTQAQAAALSADEVMQRNHQATRLDSSISEATFRLVSPSGQERVRKTFGATRLRADGVSNRRLVRFLSPSDTRNTATLLLENAQGDDEIWVYLPALKKARRLAASNKKSSFVGTDLSYGDMSGHKPADWTHRLLRNDSLGGVGVYVVESAPKTPEVAADSGYARRISWVARDSFAALKVEFFDPAGAPLKTVESSEWKQVDAARHKWQAMQVKVSNQQTGHTTHIHIDRFEANVPVADEVFSVRSIEKEE